MSEYAIYPSLKDRSVFITGGGSGIGAALVRHFAAQGSKVAFVDIAAAASEQLVADVAAAGDPTPLFIECDLRDIEALRRAIRARGRRARADHGAGQQRRPRRAS